MPTTRLVVKVLPVGRTFFFPLVTCEDGPNSRDWRVLGSVGSNMGEMRELGPILRTIIVSIAVKRTRRVVGMARATPIYGGWGA